MDIRRFFDQATSTLTYVVHGRVGEAANPALNSELLDDFD
jgi:hypothetical protein